MTEGEAEVELVGAGGAYGLFDVNEPARWSTLEIKLGDIIATAVPGELLGADGVEGIFLVTGIELGADGSALVRVKSVGSSHPEALAILSSFFNRKEGHLHVCASAGFCGEEGGVFHVQRLELWDGLTFPTHRLSPAGKRIVKQFEAGEELDEVREPLEGAAGRPSALRKKPSGEPKEAQLRGKGQGDRRDRPKDIRKSAKAKQPGPAGSAAGTLRARLDQVRKRQQSLGLGQGALTGGDHLGVEGDGDADPVQEGLGTSTKLGPPKGAAGPRRAALTSGEGHGEEQKEDILKPLRMMSKKSNVASSLALQAARTSKSKDGKKKKKKKKQKAVEALQTIFGGGKKKKKKKRKREGDDPSGSSPSSDEGDSYSSGEDVDSSETDKEDLLPPLKKRSERMEGSVLSLLIERIEARLNELSGAGESSDPVLTGTKVVTYWHTLIQSGAFSQQSRDGRETYLLANVIDLLRVGRLAKLGDALAARWLAIEQASLDQQWSAARHLELYSPDQTSAAGPAITLAARKFSKMMERVTQPDEARGRVRKDKGGKGDGGWQDAEPWWKKRKGGKDGKKGKEKEKADPWSGRGGWRKNQDQGWWKKDKNKGKGEKEKEGEAEK